MCNSINYSCLNNYLISRISENPVISNISLTLSFTLEIYNVPDDLVILLCNDSLILRTAEDTYSVSFRSRFNSVIPAGISFSLRSHSGDVDVSSLPSIAAVIFLFSISVVTVIFNYHAFLNIKLIVLINSLFNNKYILPILSCICHIIHEFLKYTYSKTTYWSVICIKSYIRFFFFQWIILLPIVL